MVHHEITQKSKENSMVENENSELTKPSYFADVERFRTLVNFTWYIIVIGASPLSRKNIITDKYFVHLFVDACQQ